MKGIIATSLFCLSALTAGVAAAEYSEEQLAMQYLLVAEGVISSPKEIDSRLAYLIDKQRNWHDIKRLLEAGANPDGAPVDPADAEAEKAPHNRSYLYKCVRTCEDVRLMYMLIDAGAGVNVSLPDNLTLLHHIAVRFENFRKMNPTQWEDFLDVLINRGINLNQQTGEGITALMIASKNANLDLVKYLVDKGADTSLRLNKGQRAMDLVPEENENAAQIREILQSAEQAS